MDIKDTALKYLASRARTSGEMKRHLTEKGFEQEQIRELIDQLKELRYLDDEDYCIRYFEYAFAKGKGIMRVKRELEEKGVKREGIDLSWEEYDPSETELSRAEKQAAKVAEGRTPDQKLIGKIGRKLTSLGYSSDIIYQVIGKYMRNQDQ